MRLALLVASLAIASSAMAQPYTRPLAVDPAKPSTVTGNTNVPTYSAAIVALANTGAGDLYCIGGSATKTVKIKGIRVSATASSAIVIDASIVLRSAAGSGGTSSSPAVIASDQNNAAGTATVTAYSVSPTPGAAIGTIRAQKISVGTQGNSAISGVALYQFSVYWDQPVVLRGTAQFACVNISAAGTGATFDIDHEHTEE